LTDNKSVLVLPEELFTCVIETTALDKQIWQKQNNETINQWIKARWKLQKQEGVWWKDLALVITEFEALQKDLMKTYHDSDTAGHPGIVCTYAQIACDYWWPELQKYVRAYVKGCGVCQQNKSNTHLNKPLLNPIFPPKELEPFKVISVDLITKLPQSRGNDMILTITNQGSTKAIILILCQEDMGAEEMATLYVKHAFPYIRLPS
jgi:hypothetical protein